MAGLLRERVCDLLCGAGVTLDVEAVRLAGQVATLIYALGTDRVDAVLADQRELQSEVIDAVRFITLRATEEQSLERDPLDDAELETGERMLCAQARRFLQSSQSWVPAADLCRHLWDLVEERGPTAQDLSSHVPGLLRFLERFPEAFAISEDERVRALSC